VYIMKLRRTTYFTTTPGSAAPFPNPGIYPAPDPSRALASEGEGRESARLASITGPNARTRWGNIAGGGSEKRWTGSVGIEIASSS
jgi:hypothetical protein